MVLLSLAAFGQTDFVPPTSDMVDGQYYEGIRKYTNVSSGMLQLKSFIIRQESRKFANGKFEARFYIDGDISNQDLEIFFEDRSESYYMIPVKKKWAAGYHTLQWDAKKMAASLKLDDGSLLGFIKVKNPGSRDRLVPLSFSESLSKDYFQWVFKADQEVTVEYSISELNGKILSGPTTIKDHPSGQYLEIRWGPDAPMPEGRYALNLKYAFTGGKRVTRGTDSFTFYVVGH
jgi:hypothetical protein